MSQDKGNTVRVALLPPSAAEAYAHVLQAEGDILALLSFVGERISVCDEVILLRSVPGDGAEIGCLTISPEGEGTGQPTFVGYHIRRRYRGHQDNYEEQLIAAGLQRVRERGVPLPIRVDLVLASDHELLACLSPEVRTCLHSCDFGRLPDGVSFT